MAEGPAARMYAYNDPVLCEPERIRRLFVIDTIDVLDLEVVIA